MTTHQHIDPFYLDGGADPAGSITTTVSDGRYATASQFTSPDGHQVAGRLDLVTSGSVLAWTAFAFEGDGRVVTGERTPAGVSVDGRAVTVDGDVIPSYGRSGLVTEFAASGDESIDFVWLEETSDGCDSAATLTRAGSEAVSSRVRGTVEDCQRVELTVDGVRTNTYWVKDGVIAVADWGGARSFVGVATEV